MDAIGGKEKGKHSGKKLRAGRGTVAKIPVVGMRDRSGRTKAKPIATADTHNLHAAIIENVETGSMLHTDEHAGYHGLGGMFYSHKVVNHSAGEFVRDGVSTDGIESVWAVLKRGLHGVYHHASDKHLARYVDEFTFRLNDGNVQRHTLNRPNSFVDATVGRHITYRELTA